MVQKLNIPYGRQNITDEDIKEVERVLRSDFLTQGPEVPKFESEYSKFIGSKYCVAVNSATSALHLSCLALGLKEGDRLWTSAVTFVASANCALYCGSSVDLIDIDKLTNNISIDDFKKKLKKSKKENTLPKIVIPVHLAGLSCEMEEIKNLSMEYGFKIIEDASHAAGGSYKSKKIGSCEYSDMSVFSFHPVKNFTTGEGGIISTNSEELYVKLKNLREHGINKDPSSMIYPSDGPWYYEQVGLGFNYRMTDISAALGNSQLKRLEANTLKRNEIASFYAEELKDLPLFLPNEDSSGTSGRHLYIIKLNLSRIEKTHEEVFVNLRENGIGVNIHYIPVYRHPFYQKFKFDLKLFPNSEAYYSSAISIPMFPELQDHQLSYIVDSIKGILQ